MKERNFSHIREFCDEACSSGVETIILCYTDEWGPSPGEGNAVHCGPRLEMTLLAYHEGCIWRCCISGPEAERSLVQEQIESHGLNWELRSRNTAKYGS